MNIEEIVRKAGLGAFFRPSQIEQAGVSYNQLQRLVRDGEVEHVARGLYRLTSVELTENYSIAAVCARVPTAIVCLLSALRVHNIGTQLPREIWIAIPHKARAPRVSGNAVRLVRFSGRSAQYGVETACFEGVPARITNPARTVVDCFRLQRLVGREVAMEALRDSIRDRVVTVDQLWRTAEVCRARSLIEPYLESLSV